MSDNKQYGFYVDTSKCTGCKTCQVSCKDKNDLPVGMNFRRVYEYGGGQWTKDDNGIVTQDVFAYYTSIGCNHCAKPACVKVCPVGAYSKDPATGLVKHDQAACIGCKLCISSSGCPYDAPQFDTSKGKMSKCDGCADRLAEGKKPTCVESCPMRALDFDTLDALKAKYPSAGQPDVAPLPASSLTDPSLLIAKNRLSRPSGSTDGDVLNWAEV